MPLPTGTGETFAGYTIVRLLGSGGMGEVYLVQHPRLPRQDALKVLRRDVSADASFRDRFIREAAWRRVCGIPTSSGCMTVASMRDSFGSQWITSMGSMQHS